MSRPRDAAQGRAGSRTSARTISSAAQPRVMDLLTALAKAKRKLDGASYDMTRPDKHPNDMHKALRKVEEAERLLADVRLSLREGFDV